MHKVTRNGFVWLVIDKETATAILNIGKIDLYALYGNDSEELIRDIGELEKIKNSGFKIGIKVGFIKNLLPRCRRCGNVLTPSRIDGYTWECLNCEEDFVSVEI